jgi:hypothetical protein
MLISSDGIANYQRDGVIHLPQVLDTATLDLAQRGFAWSVNHPTPSACQFYGAEGSNFYQDLCHPQAVEQSQSLEFVRGSHRQALYNGSAFDDDDDTAPIYAHGLPRLPDIESERDSWDIVSWAIEPGDVVIFHPSTLHGGAPTKAGQPRRTLSLRFFGPTATYAERPERAPAPLTAGLHDALEYGQVFRHPAFPQVRPDAHGFENIPADLGHDIALKSQIQGS